MTIAVDMGRKATKTNKQTITLAFESLGKNRKKKSGRGDGKCKQTYPDHPLLQNDRSFLKNRIQ